MTDALYHLEFRGPLPDPLTVGDKIQIAGTATVSQITARLVDMTPLGSASEYTVGDTEIGLYSNRVEISL